MKVMNTLGFYSCRIGLSIGIVVLLGIAVSAQYQDRKLVFSDEFNAAAGKPVDASKWTSETGGQGWGNREFQYYTNSTENAFHDGNGSLVIKAIKKDLPDSYKCWYGKCKYTSARLITKNKFEHKYGRFEARIKVPKGQGIWPAFWMLGNDFDNVGWPHCGEIDILENIGREPKKVYGTIHGPGYSGQYGIGKSYRLPTKRPYAENYHVFAVEWKKNQIEWFVDGKRFSRLTPKKLPKGKKWVFDHPFFMLLNLAVGGNWPGSPDKTTVFPQELKIDYVRVYSEIKSQKELRK